MIRKTIFWSHLVAGLISALSIGIMCFTGTVLAFEKQLIAWSQRDARQITPPAENAPRLTLAQLQAKLREAQPEARTTTVVLQNDPRVAVAFSAGGRGGAVYYANPYTGEVRPPQSTAMGGFMQTMVTWHRYLGFTGETTRPRGKLINGVCNLAFCVLAVTGLYLWMPRTWSWRGVKAIALFNGRLAGKARDFNWHNSIGLWSAPVLIVLTLTAVPISFQWGGRLINTLTGTPQPARGAPTGAAAAVAAPVVVPTPPAEARPLSQEDLIAKVQQEMPRWETITISTAVARPANTAPISPAPAAPPTAPVASFVIRDGNSWPRTATTTLALDPYTGEVLRRTGYATLAPAQQVRSWTRFLHTGEALGPVGQLVAGLACLGGCFLVYTGIALSWRRFFGKRGQPTAEV